MTTARINSLGIYTGTNLRRWSRADLAAQFGKSAEYLFGIVIGIDCLPVEVTASANRVLRTRSSLTLSGGTRRKPPWRSEHVITLVPGS